MERWFQDIKINHQAVYFNAWQNDYSNDPLISLISSIISQILSLNQEGQQTDATKNFLKKSGAIIKKLSPMIVKGILRKYIGEDGLEEFSKTTKDTEDTIADISGKLTEELLENFKQTENLIEEFKKSISSIIENPSNKKLQKPLFIFIDELDRCRPNFAIELLEKIKHIFNIEDVIFIIATDTRQLSYSIKAIYGQDFNGETYLRRFFDQIYTLPKPDCVKFVAMLFSGYKEKAQFYNYGINATGGSITQGKNENTLTFDKDINSEKILIFSLFSKFFDLDLRTNKQCFERFIAIENSWQNESNEIHFTYLVFLIMLDARHPAEFEIFFSNPDKRKFLLSIGTTKANIRVSTKYCTAIDFVNIYIECLFIPRDQVMRELDKHYGANPSSFEPYLTSRILNNFDNINQYKCIVEMADALS